MILVIHLASLSLLFHLAPSIGFSSQMVVKETVEKQEVQVDLSSVQPKDVPVRPQVKESHDSPAAALKAEPARQEKIQKETFDSKKTSTRLLKLLEERQKLLGKLRQKKGWRKKGFSKAETMPLLEPYDEQWAEEQKKFEKLVEGSDYLGFLNKIQDSKAKVRDLSILKRYLTKDGSERRKSLQAAQKNFKEQDLFSRMAVEFEENISKTEDKLKEGNEILKGLVKNPELSRLQHMLGMIRSSPEKLSTLLNGDSCGPKLSRLDKIRKFLFRKEGGAVNPVEDAMDSSQTSADSSSYYSQSVTPLMLAAAALKDQESIDAAFLDPVRKHLGDVDSRGANSLRYAVEALNPITAAWILEKGHLGCGNCLGHDPENPEKKTEFDEDFTQKLLLKIQRMPEKLRPKATHDLEILKGLFLKPAGAISEISDNADVANQKVPSPQLSIDEETQKKPSEAKLSPEAIRGDAKSFETSMAKIADEPEAPKVIATEGKLARARLARSHENVLRYLKASRTKSAQGLVQSGAPVFLKQESHKKGYQSPLMWAAVNDKSLLIEFLKAIPEGDRQKAIDHTLTNSYAEAEKGSLIVLLDNGAKAFAGSAQEKAGILQTLTEKLQGTHYVAANLNERVTVSSEQGEAP